MKVGVLLSGCGYLDGAALREAVLALLALDKAGAELLCCAPDVAQLDVVDHRTGEPAAEARNVLAESARIARGDVVDVATVRAADLDALVLPGGFGVAKTLCTFAQEGARATVLPEVARLVRETLEARKPLGAICIAPALVALVLRDMGRTARLTLGEDGDAAKAVKELGHEHVRCPVDECRVDEEQRLVTTPAYMYGDARVSKVALGIERAVGEVLRLAT